MRYRYLVFGIEIDTRDATGPEVLGGVRVAETGENVVIQAGLCTLTLMPQFGGKIASIRIGQHELLQAPLNPYAPRTQSMPFQQGDASGWDECLPSVAACTIPLLNGEAHIPDHGDLWRVPWTVVDQSPDSATMRANCFSLPLELTRSLILTELSSASLSPTSPSAGFRLQILYTLTNHGDAPVPWSWAAHPLFVAAPGDAIALPGSIHTLRIEGSGGNRLGHNGDQVLWPIATLSDGSHTDLSLAQPAQSGIGDKLFAGPLTDPADNWCALHRPSIGLSLTVRFDPTLTPYLGLWICYGGWPDGDGKKQVCVALEPATAPVDSLAHTGPWSNTLAPGATFTWPMQLEILPLPGSASSNTSV